MKLNLLSSTQKKNYQRALTCHNGRPGILIIYSHNKNTSLKLNYKFCLIPRLEQDEEP